MRRTRRSRCCELVHPLADAVQRVAVLLERWVVGLLMNADDEAHRHACEVDYVLARPGKAARNEYLALVAKARGQAAADQLKADAMVEWRRRQDSVPARGVDGSASGVSPTH